VRCAGGEEGREGKATKTWRARGRGEKRDGTNRERMGRGEARWRTRATKRVDWEEGRGWERKGRMQ
jgi:hypothetical protein